MVHALTEPVLEPSTEGGGRSKKTGPQPVAARADLADKFLHQHQDRRKEFFINPRCVYLGTGVNVAPSGINLEPPRDKWHRPAAAARLENNSSAGFKRRGALTCSMRLRAGKSASTRRRRRRALSAGGRCLGPGARMRPSGGVSSFKPY